MLSLLTPPQMQLNCPCQLGAAICNAPLGHDGLHTSNRRLTDSLTINVLWCDEWLPLSREAELQIGGCAQEISVA